MIRERETEKEGGKDKDRRGTEERTKTEKQTIVKRVSWFKSSLLLRINNKHTYKY